MAYTTRMSMLLRIKDGNEIGWDEFYDTYRPLIHLRAGDRGLLPDERDELLQNVMISIFKSKMIFSYDPEKGRFRTYLKNLVDRRAIDLLRKRRPEVADLDTLEEQGRQPSSSDHEKQERRWEKAWRQHLLRQGLVEVQRHVTEPIYQAFRRCTLERQDPKGVAKDLGISVASVYMAKHRVLARLRVILSDLEAQS
jgi:RNA polymerase sigma-70 factor (ECF subfamily)